MEKSILLYVRELIDYINENKDFYILYPEQCAYSEHIGALFTDIILQAGLNYKKIVKPRVEFVLNKYPEANSVKKFYFILKKNGAENVLQWNNKEKIGRVHSLINFCLLNELNTSSDIKYFLSLEDNQKEFLNIRGIGYKTLDYFLKLLNSDTVAVDRHIYAFLERAGIESADYFFVKSIVEYAADIMNVSRRSMDCSIWHYMSNSSEVVQLSLRI